MHFFAEYQGRLEAIFEKRILLIVGATRWGTAWVQQCLDAHPNACAKGEGHFTDILFPKIAKAVDEYNAESEKIGNRLQLAGLAGNAAGCTVDDVDHLLRTAVALMLNRWIGDTEVTWTPPLTSPIWRFCDSMAFRGGCHETAWIFRPSGSYATSV